MRRGAERMTFPEENGPPPEDNDPGNKWWEEKPGVRAYHLWEAFDVKDKTRDYYRCPYCDLRAKGTRQADGRLMRHIKLDPEREEFECPRGDTWMANFETKRVEPMG